MSASNILTGKVALVTGANTGIGRVTALELASQGARVFLACRSRVRADAVLSEIRAAGGEAEYLPLDLGNLDAVRECAQLFLQRELPLHILVLNAGLAGSTGLTVSGFELAFGTCHVGHFLLTQLLMERLKASAPARVVVVSSKAHRHVKSIDFEALRAPTRTPGGIKEYSVAKLANLLFAGELARRLAGTGVNAYAVHPGIVASDVWRAVPGPLRWLAKRFMLSPEDGARTSLYCATSADVAAESGLYYDNCRAAQPSVVALDTALAGQLWRASQKWVQEG